MSARKKTSSTGAMLELWRAPRGVGDPLGCLTTTYTFTPALFDEQCLARFLEIDSEPDREDLAFLLERESRLGGVFAGVLVDHTQAGVEHSLRWDVLPVLIPAAKQHAKLSLLAWGRHIRIIVASANLTDPGYRYNQEVAAAVDLAPEASNSALLGEATHFLRDLLVRVPGSQQESPELRRASAFLEQVEQLARDWVVARQNGRVRQQFVFTLPGDEASARSSLQEAVAACRRRGGSPSEAWVASPFFDPDQRRSLVTASMCKAMARGERRRKIRFCVPAVRSEGSGSLVRLAAPRSLLATPRTYECTPSVETLPDYDTERNRRPWHAKMLALFGDTYSALMIGSSNFTCAGMGTVGTRNAEANLVTIVDYADYGRESGQLKAVWPETERVADPDTAEWEGSRADNEDEGIAATSAVEAGFLSATYRAGDVRQLVLRFEVKDLPPDWAVHACGQHEHEILTAAQWHERGDPSETATSWAPVAPPARLRVQWNGKEAFLAVNVEDGSKLPPPLELNGMTADDMLLILAAADPSAAFRVWVRRHHVEADFDADKDSAAPIDLDPLRRYDLRATFLHRVRYRARVLAQLRAGLERPAWSRQALEWRLRGMIGVEQLAERYLLDFTVGGPKAGEALLTLADFLIVLREVDYKPVDGALAKEEFDDVFRSFLAELANSLAREVARHRAHVSADIMEFWNRVVTRCQS